ncbi:TMV resistance protein N-like [Pyrus ussuriensis x Pyrus communis]|uniref:TMV resistance protein N-like n=1 Tax=Pyrus ussuriensis x Pyrus communis TaxID=2448454 RepID=A0A5N5HLP5_9ROSA|nr:TMV resistance protein N-like [Pyrus ussuriensis x Pyrus communis]
MSTRTQHEASSSSKRWMHDVFLSFRGEDTRNGFTGHLCMTLKEAGVNVFIDNQLRRGEEITAELVQAIRGWCLQELVEIMECRRRLGQIVLPVFYDVDPSHVRKQTSASFAQAFQKHEECFHEDTDKVARWRAALTEASNLSGWDLKNTADGHEALFIRRIIGEITKQLDTTYLNVAVYQVGIDSRVNEINSLDRGSYDVQMFYHSFVYKSFLGNVRETAKELNGMTNLQEKLLSDIFKPTKMEVGDVHRGIDLIKEKLRSRAVLVIIDDVDDVDQLNALAIARDSFGRGSKIFITTRDRHLLEQVEVNIIYLAQKMKEEEALELFSWHAFRNPCPNEEYSELTRSVLGYCGGLPLALEVLGSFLFKRSLRDWTSTLKKLEKIPRFEIQEKLKISFDALSDEDEREIFLDISCFFIGMDKNSVTRILDGCGFFAEIGISVLLQRCLVTVDEKNKLVMHDLLRDMGREIVRAKFPNHPGNCSRLWRQEDAIGVLTDKSGTEDIEGLALNLLKPDKASFSMKAFRKMKRLRSLETTNIFLRS